MRFYTGNMFPAAYNGTILIAQRGSWDRSVKIGYRVMAVRLDPATLRPTSFEPFATGWLAGGAKPTADSTAWGEMQSPACCGLQCASKSLLSRRRIVGARTVAEA
jgi:hypothetical protein